MAQPSLPARRVISLSIDPDSHSFHSKKSCLKEIDRSNLRMANNASKALSSQAKKLLFGESMPVFVVLGNWTDEGFKNVEDAPGRIKDTHNAVAEARGKMQLYYTLGEYDFVMVLDVPDEKTIMKILLWLGSKGNVRTKTLKAWTEDEAAKVISDLKQS